MFFAHFETLIPFQSLSLYTNGSFKKKLIEFFNHDIIRQK
jgi:hypothetical protein